MLLFCLWIGWSGFSGVSAKQIFREDFRAHDPHYSICTGDLVHRDKMRLVVTGQHGGKMKLSHHVWMKDPHYMWNGKTDGPTAALFHFVKAMNLSDPRSVLRVNTRHSGVAESYPMVRSDGKWFVAKVSHTGQTKFVTFAYKLHELEWKRCDPVAMKIGAEGKVKWENIQGLGFFNVYQGEALVRGSKRSSTRINWFEVCSATAQPWSNAQLKLDKKGGKIQTFFELKVPSYYTGIQYKLPSGKVMKYPRTIITRLGRGYWSCFDIESCELLLLWKAVGDKPIALDAVSAFSCPNVRKKDTELPEVVGEVVWMQTSPREKRGTQRQWLGCYHAGESAIWHYSINGREIYDRCTWLKRLSRELHVASGKKRVVICHPTKEQGSRKITLSQEAFVVRLKEDKMEQIVGQGLQKPDVAKDLFPQRFFMYSARAEKIPYGTLKRFSLPEKNPYNRAIRITDIGFLQDGTAIVTTLDGDVWKVARMDTKEPEWKRFAVGLYEANNVEVGPDDRIYILCRDQIVEIIDRNKDDWVDYYRCVSNVFHTCDVFFSMGLLKDGSFLVAKGWGGKDSEMGCKDSVFKISSDGRSKSIIAGDLRIPYVGIGASGAVYVSDQQRNYLGATSIYKMENGEQYGGVPTAKDKKIPYLGFPYLQNCLAAGFAALPKEVLSQAYPAVLHHVWGERLYVLPENSPTSFAWSISEGLDFSSVNSAFRPTDGGLYVVGTGISNYKEMKKNAWGLVRIQLSKTMSYPIVLEATQKQTKIVFSKRITEPVKVLSYKVWSVKSTRGDDSSSEHNVVSNRLIISDEGKTVEIHHSDLWRSEAVELILKIGKKVYTLIVNGNGFPPAPKGF